MAESTETIAVGIDLGTTNSCVAIVENGRVIIVPDEQGRRIMPSMFTYTNDEEMLIGWDAFHQAHVHLRNTAYEAKRLIGQNFDDEKVEKFRKKCAYEVLNADNVIQIRLGGIEFYPEEISGRILERLKKVVEDYTQKRATEAVITVPAYFGGTQREATVEAAILAGFDVVRTINEPTAAALAFQHDRPNNTKQNILIYDFGGGTFDVTVAETEGKKCRVLATNGDCFLGGTDIDMDIMNYIKANISEQIYNRQYNTLKYKSEEAKKKLSVLPKYEIELHGCSLILDRNILNNMNEVLFKKTIAIAKECVQYAGLELEDINIIVPIGGSSRIPKLREMMGQVFKYSRISGTINPDEAVAYGAALYATNMFTNDQEMNIKDVLSLSLGVEIELGQMHFILRRNTPIPCEHVEIFNASSSSFILKLYQGESLLVQNNHFVGQCIIDDVPIAQSIEVKFSFDEDGILTVLAQTGNQIQLKIDMTKRKLSEEEWNRSINYENKTENELKYLRFSKKKQHFDFYCQDLKLKLQRHHQRSKITKEINTYKKKLDKFSPDDVNKIDEFIHNLNKLYNKPKPRFYFT